MGWLMTNIDLMNFAEIAQAALDCACEALAAASRPVCVCELTIGPPAWDTCDCQCSSGGRGQLAVYPITTYASRRFPDPATTDDRADPACGPAFKVTTFGIQISRCIGDWVIDGETLTAAQIWYGDETVIRQAIGCCLADLKGDKTIRAFLLGATAPLQEQGNCAGSAMTFQVGIGSCLCPPYPVT